MRFPIPVNSLVFYFVGARWGSILHCAINRFALPRYPRSGCKVWERNSRYLFGRLRPATRFHLPQHHVRRHKHIEVFFSSSLQYLNAAIQAARRRRASCTPGEYYSHLLSKEYIKKTNQWQLRTGRIPLRTLVKLKFSTILFSLQ